MTSEIKYKTLYKSKVIEVVTPDIAPDYEMLHEGDIVNMIPILPDGRIGIRLEWIPPYLMKDTSGNDKYYTIMSGTIDGDDGTKETAVRELREEAGLIIKKSIIIDLLKKVPVCKSTDMRVSLFLFDIQDYVIEKPEGDGTKTEDKSSTVWVTLQEFADIFKGSNIDLLVFTAYNIVKLYFDYKDKL